MPGTVLLIDDNEDIRNNIGELLELSNYTVILAANGKEGIELAKQKNPDIIVCDVMMPDIDGWGVLHILKKDTATENIPFIYLTAKTEKIDFRTAIELGANDYITKPFQTNEFLNSIESVLRRSKKPLPSKNNNIEKEQPEETVKSTADALTILIKECEVREYKKKDVIYKEGGTPRYLYYINNGKVKTFKNHEDGKELITDLYGDKDYLGFSALLNGTMYNETAKAIDDSEIALIPRISFEQLLQNSPDVTKKFMSLVARILLEKDKQLVGIAYNTLRKKVANALLTLERKYNKKKDEGFIINMGRDELAAIAGTATESLVRTLTDFKSEKLIEMQNGPIEIINLKKLEALLS